MLGVPFVGKDWYVIYSLTIFIKVFGSCLAGIVDVSVSSISRDLLAA